MHKIPVEDTEGFCSQRCMDYINFYMLFSRYNDNLSIFLEKNLIGVKFIASILDVRKDNREICSILWSKDKLIAWREIALVQYNSQCEFTLIDSVMAECKMSCSEKKRGFLDCECFAPKGKELNLNHRIN